MAKMNDNETMAALQASFASAYTDYTTLQKQRTDALNFYYGRPMGNEIEGRSQVVSKDLMDAVEWTMPSMMRVCATPHAVQFDPVGPEDAEQAKQETLYVNHVFWKKNDGFTTAYTWIKDGLYQKVGYVAYWWEVEEKTCTERYTGLTQDQLAMTMQTLEEKGEVEVVGAEATHTAPGMPQLWDVEVKIKTKKGRAVVEAVPPDEMVVSGDCRGSIKNAKFAGRLCKKTRSKLLEEGFKRADIEKLTDFTWEKTATESARSPLGQVEEADDGVGWANKELTLLDCFTNLDVDDDGYAERRHFIAGGNDILVNEEAEEIQFCSWTPILTPHKHVGMDLYDLTEDFQRINTALTRGLLDNTYFSMNQRTAYNKNTVNVGMLQVNRPGGHVAVDGDPGTAIMPIVTPVDTGMRLLPVIQHFNAKRDERTGAGSMTRGVDADVLAQATKGAYMAATGAANQRLEGFATIFAKTGYADLYQSLHGLLRRNQDWPEQFKIKKDWVTTNPAEWNERTDLTVSVGQGTAGKEEIRQNLLLMGSQLQIAAQIPGLVQPANAYAYMLRLQSELGFESEQFLTDPGSDEYKQWAQSQKPPADPYVEGAKIKAQTDLQKAQLDARNKTLDRAQERDLTITTLEVNAAVDLAKPGIGAEVAVARGNVAPGGPRNGATEQSAAQ